MSKVKVSVVSITYNQEKYVAEMLESVVSQKTSFAFEVLVADDGSTDKTREIIRQYADKYPDIVKPILREKNIGAWNNFTDAFKKATGSYIALCEGDDYWTNPEKLQKQVDFLDKHPDYSICFHKTRVVYEGIDKKDSIYPDVDDLKWYNFKELLSINYIPTASVMYRRQNYSDLAPDMMPGDWYLHVYHAKFGKIKIINEVMSVYRKHKGGIWWDFDTNRDLIWHKYGFSYVRLYDSFLDAVKDQPAEYAAIVKKLIYETIQSIARVDVKFKDKKLDVIADAFPQYILPFMCYISVEYEQKKQESEKYRKELLRAGDKIHEFDVKLAETHNKLAVAESDIEAIKSTKTWKARSVVAEQYKRIKRK